MNIHFRKANTEDIPFIINAIIEAEKSGTEVLSYSRIFNITELEVEQLISNILDEELEGQEWCLAHFYIAEYANKQAACLSAWIEGLNGLGSGILKAQAMSYFLGDKWQKSKSQLESVAMVQIPRSHGALQLENIYTAPDFRGQGIIGQLIDFVVANYPSDDIVSTYAEIHLMENNEKALHSYTKCGFLEDAKNTAADDVVLTLLPSKTRIALKRIM